MIEVKPNNGLTETTSKGVRQMSDKWITSSLPDDLRNNGEELLNILDGGRLLVNYESKANGNLFARELDELGHAITSSTRLR